MAAVRTFVGYELRAAGPVRAALVGRNGAMTPRHVTPARLTGAPVMRTSVNGQLVWKVTAGPWSGLAFVPGFSTGDWYVVKRFREAGGSVTDERIGQSGA